MRKRVLFCATVDYHFSAFHLPYLKWFKEQGWEVHVAAAGELELPYTDKKYNLSIQRSPFNKKNIGAYKQLKAIMDENQYKVIHCHTPMGGVLARLAARSTRRHGTKVIYTAHGFHFCKGAPLLNWLFYYPIERSLSHLTDCLITINKEDYQLAVRHGFKASRIEHVHGVGVDTERFSRIKGFHKSVLRAEHHYDHDAFLLVYAAEFNRNKNQQLLIKALALIKEQVPSAKLLLAGEGVLLEDCRQLAKKLGVEDMVHFLGFRNDVEHLVKMSDLAVASSLREGLPVNIMEAMACGLPIIAVDNRGHRELVQNDKNGWLIGRNDLELADRIMTLAKNNNLRRQLGLQSRRIILEKYSLNRTLNEQKMLYAKLMDEMEVVQWAVH